MTLPKVGAVVKEVWEARSGEIYIRFDDGLTVKVDYRERRGGSGPVQRVGEEEPMQMVRNRNERDDGHRVHGGEA